MALVWDKTLYDTLYSCNGWPYGIRGATRVPRFHYNWFGQQHSMQTMVERYLALPGFAQVSDVAIIGGGYGWTAELLESQGINAISVDTSPHILSTKDSSEEQELRDTLTALNFDPDRLNDGPAGIRFMSPDDPNAWVNPWTYWLRPDGKRTSKTVVDEDLSTTTSRNNVKSALGNNIDAIVTEFAIDSFEAGDDAGSLQLVERCEQLRPNPACAVIHLIEPNPADVFLNVKTASAWRTLLDTNGYNHVIVDMQGNILTAGG
jgi:hypothetical protein